MLLSPMNLTYRKSVVTEMKRYDNAFSTPEFFYFHIRFIELNLGLLNHLIAVVAPIRLSFIVKKWGSCYCTVTVPTRKGCSVQKYI
jgi:hypothetical protein